MGTLDEVNVDVKAIEEAVNEIWNGWYPEVNTVVVFTGGNYLTKRPPFKILKKYIIPAVS